VVVLVKHPEPQRQVVQVDLAVEAVVVQVVVQVELVIHLLLVRHKDKTEVMQQVEVHQKPVVVEVVQEPQEEMLHQQVLEVTVEQVVFFQIQLLAQQHQVMELQDQNLAQDIFLEVVEAVVQTMYLLLGQEVQVVELVEEHQVIQEIHNQEQLTQVVVAVVKKMVLVQVEQVVQE
tara:strand:- start:43 stop:567 length:525 start_codon:yes stop_codon:yes gene_type:complete